MTESIRRALAMSAETLGPRQVKLRASTEALGRDDLVVVTRGIDLGSYRANPVMLWGHDPDQPIARASEVQIEGGELRILADFAEAGTSQRADEICGLVKQGIVSGISIGFQPLETEPLDPKNRNAGRRITRSELMEVSFVSIPAVRDALVTQRAKPDDEPASEPAPPAAEDRSMPKLTARGLYECAQLACTLNDLGWLTSWVKYEAQCEGDNSPVPAMLVSVMKEMGAALAAMTEEEVAEAIAAVSEEGDDDFDVMTQAAKPADRLQRAVAVLAKRAGAKHSAATINTLNEALDHITRGMDCIRGMMEGGEGEGDRAAPVITAPNPEEFLKRKSEIERLFRRGDTDRLAVMHIA